MRPIILGRVTPVAVALGFAGCAEREGGSLPLERVAPANASTAAMSNAVSRQGSGWYKSADGTEIEVEIQREKEPILYLVIWQGKSQTLHVFCVDIGIDGVVDECHLVDHAVALDQQLPSSQADVFFRQALRRLTGEGVSAPSRAWNQKRSDT